MTTARGTTTADEGEYGGLGRRRAYLLLGIASLGYAWLMFVWFSLPALLTPLAADLGLSGTQSGLLNGVIPLVYVPLSLASGLVVDRVGSRRAIGVGLVCFGVAQTARSVAPGFRSLLVLTALIGVGGTGITFGLPKLVAEYFPSERSGTSSSIYLLGSYLGIAAAFGLSRPLLEPALGGWRPTFRWTGVAALGFALCWIVASRRLVRRSSVDPPTSDREASDTATISTDTADESPGADDPGSDSNADTDGAFTVRSIVADVRLVSAHRELRLLVVVGTMYLLVFHGLQSWLAVVLEARGFASGVAAGMATLLIVTRAVGTAAIPPLSDALGRRRAVVIGCGVCAVGGGVGLLPSSAGFWLTAVAVTVAGVGVGGLGPMIRALPIEMRGIGPRLTGTAVGLVFAIGEIGGFLGPFLVGGLRDVTGSFVPGLAVLAAGGAVVIGAGYAMAEP